MYKAHPIVNEKPERTEWKKCSSPGCRRKATNVVRHTTQRMTYRCARHTDEFCAVLQSVEDKRGNGIARRKNDAFGGWIGWRYWLVDKERGTDIVPLD